ncbi:MAG: FliH/SctL family protein [Acidimicrobiales bacterium]
MHSLRDHRASIRVEGAAAEPIPNLSIIGRRDAPAEARLEGFRAGREEGFAVGREEGRATSEAAVASALGALSALVADYQQRLDFARGEVEQLAVALAVELAEVLLGRQLAEIEPGSDVIARALALRCGAEPVRIRMHPADAALIGASDHPDVTIVPDPGLARGAAAAESGGGLADISIAAAIERVREVLS